MNAKDGNDQKKGTYFMPSKMSGADLQKHLSDGGQPIRRTFRGWVKLSSANDCISFAPLSNCELWIDLPTAIISEVRVTGQATCDDHSHSVAAISVVDSPGSAANTLCQLLTALSSQHGLVRKYRAVMASRRSPSSRNTPEGFLSQHSTKTRARSCSTCAWVCGQHGDDSNECKNCWASCVGGGGGGGSTDCYEDENGFLVCD